MVRSRTTELYILWLSNRTLGLRSYDVTIFERKMELFGYYCDDETALLASVLTFIWLHFLWETYLKHRQVKLLFSSALDDCFLVKTDIQ